MSGLQFQGRQEAFRLISGGAAYNLALNFQPDVMEVINITQWTNTAANLPIHMWFRDDTAAAEAYQMQVIDSSAGASFNFLNPTTNGFTVADTSGGNTAYRALISAVSQADPCVITTTAAHGYQTNQMVKITDLGSDMPTARGMEQIDGKRFSITVLTATTFSLQDPITGVDIDSSAYTAWVSGGRVNLETRANALNYPQQSPYATTPYVPNKFQYDSIDRIMTLGTEVIGDDGDVVRIHVCKFDLITELGDIG